MVNETAANIVLVEDDLRLRGLLETYLTREGFRIAVAGNSQQMEKTLRERRIDLVVLDLMLPGREESCAHRDADGERR